MTKKVLAADLDLEDRILLARPEVEIVKITDLKDKYRQAPKGKIVEVEITGGAFKGERDTIILLDEDKVDRTSTRTWWQRWFGKPKVNKTKAITSDASLIPPLLAQKKQTTKT